MNYLEQLQYVKCNASNYEYIKGSLGSDSPCYPFFSFRTPIFFPFFPHCGAWSQAIINFSRLYLGNAYLPGLETWHTVSFKCDLPGRQKLTQSEMVRLASGTTLNIWNNNRVQEQKNSF